MNTITIQFCDEDRKRIDELIAFASLLVGELRSTKDAIKFGSAPSLKTEEPPAPEEKPKIDGQISLFNEPVAEPTPEVKPVSLAEFQKAVTLAVSKGAEAKKAAKEIINKYAPSVSEVPEGKRAEVMAELAKI